MRLSIETITDQYYIKELTEKDLPEVYRLCVSNPQYYTYLKCEPTLDSLRGELAALPPGKTLDDKYFVGFYESEQMVVILDLITGYPEEKIAFIGWFMVDGALHGQGIGTGLVRSLFGWLRENGYVSVRLGCIVENAEGRRFWEKHGFSYTGKQWTTEDYAVLVLEKEL